MRLARFAVSFVNRVQGVQAGSSTPLGIQPEIAGANCPCAFRVADSTLSQWRKDLAAHGHNAFAGSGHQTPLEEENRHGTA
jgi:hypothetical protein